MWERERERESIKSGQRILVENCSPAGNSDPKKKQKRNIWKLGCISVATLECAPL